MEVSSWANSQMNDFLFPDRRVYGGYMGLQSGAPLVIHVNGACMCHGQGASIPCHVANMNRALYMSTSENG